MGWQETFEKIASELMKDPTHDFEHAKRVCSIAIHLAREEKADEDVVKAAALLHDVGYSLDEKGHEKKSLEIAESAGHDRLPPREKGQSSGVREDSQVQQGWGSLEFRGEDTAGCGQVGCNWRCGNCPLLPLER
ncbi:MAG: HDIG domain-containing protein [Candidatus Micrarchaeota archaeon]|nr:HDIG domain-containing protein [Candidatus Micrarchaeota archaeon]